MHTTHDLRLIGNGEKSSCCGGSVSTAGDLGSASACCGGHASNALAPEHAAVHAVGQPNTAQYQVSGMTCGHCEASIRQELAQVPDITIVEVSARTGRLVVTSSSTVDDDLVLSAVGEAGYSAVRV